MTAAAPEPDPTHVTSEDRSTGAGHEPSFNEFLLGPPYLDIDIDSYIQRSKEPIRPFDFDLEDDKSDQTHDDAESPGCRRADPADVDAIDEAPGAMVTSSARTRLAPRRPTMLQPESEYDFDPDDETRWHLHEAKQRLVEIIQRSRRGPQIIAEHDKDVAVVLSVEQYRLLKGGQPTLKEYLLAGPDLSVLDLDRADKPESSSESEPSD